MDSDLKGNILYKCKQDMEGRKRELAFEELLN